MYCVHKCICIYISLLVRQLQPRRAARKIKIELAIMKLTGRLDADRKSTLIDSLISPEKEYRKPLLFIQRRSAAVINWLFAVRRLLLPGVCVRNSYLVKELDPSAASAFRSFFIDAAAAASTVLAQLSSCHPSQLFTCCRLSGAAPSVQFGCKTSSFFATPNLEAPSTKLRKANP